MERMMDNRPIHNPTSFPPVGCRHKYVPNFSSRWSRVYFLEGKEKELCFLERNGQMVGNNYTERLITVIRVT
jgi:hypothetical protein